MINWKPLKQYVNTGKEMSIDGQPEILLFHPRFGVVVGKAMVWADGDILTIANGYHNVEFTDFAGINLPEIKE